MWPFKKPLGSMFANPSPYMKERLCSKEQAILEFRKFILPQTIAKYGTNDSVAIREDWNNWTDALYKEGRITRKNVDNWTVPLSRIRVPVK